MGLIIALAAGYIGYPYLSYYFDIFPAVLFGVFIAGIVGSHIIPVIFRKNGLLKFGNIAEWLPLYVGLLALGINRGLYLWTIVALIGGLFRIAVSALVGEEVYILSVFKGVRLSDRLREKDILSLFRGVWAREKDKGEVEQQAVMDDARQFSVVAEAHKQAVTVLLYTCCSVACLSFVAKMSGYKLPLPMVLMFIFAFMMLIWTNFAAIEKIVSWFKGLWLIRRLRQFGWIENPSEDRHKKLKQLLAELSPLWTQKKAQVKLEDLASSTWKDKEPEQKTKREWKFTDENIIFFWRNDILPTRISGSAKNVIGQILEFLDKNGGCPSVVSEQAKSYRLGGQFDEKTTYEILHKRTLMEHSLQVAKELIRDESLKNHFEKLMIAALAHDIGKAAGFKDVKAYVTGDHPKNSVTILETEIEGYSELPYAQEVSQAILFHHSSGGEKNPLIKALKDLDTSARRYEVNQYIKAQKEAEKERKRKEAEAAKNNGQETEQTEKPEIILPPVVEAGVEQNATQQASAPTPILPPMADSTNSTDKAVEEPKKEVYIPNFLPDRQVNQGQTAVVDMYRDLKPESGTPDTVDIRWFKADDFILEIHRKINKIERGWFSAITVNEGLILVLTTAAWKIIQIQARQAGVSDVIAIADNDYDNELKKSVLMSVVEMFREIGHIDGGWIKRGYFNGKFDLTDDSGNKIKDGWFIPFRFEAFEKFNTFSEYEQRKEGDLKRITKAEVSGKSN